MASYFLVAKSFIAGPPFCIELGDEWRYRGHPRGKPVEDWNPKQLAVYGPREFVERDYHQLSPFPMFSPRFQTVIREQFPGEGQFLPLRLQKPNGTEEVGGYALGNVLTVIDCLERERTVGTSYNRQFIPVGLPTLTEPNFRGGLFRLKEGNIVATNRLKAIAEELGLSGVRFVPLNVA
jgi:hypothetical protein